MVNSRGWKDIGRNCEGVFIGTSKRFDEKVKDVSLPGPGAYHSFSEFVD